MEFEERVLTEIGELKGAVGRIEGKLDNGINARITLIEEKLEEHVDVVPVKKRQRVTFILALVLGLFTLVNIGWTIYHDVKVEKDSEIGYIMPRSEHERLSEDGVGAVQSTHSEDYQY